MSSNRAPGKASTNGTPSCPCFHWAQPLDTQNARSFLAGSDDLDHAPLCDGHGNPTRSA